MLLGRMVIVAMCRTWWYLHSTPPPPVNQYTSYDITPTNYYDVYGLPQVLISRSGLGEPAIRVIIIRRPIGGRFILRGQRGG